jgi:AGZA family xanthine/uracil permease-like MFS transporter
MLATITKLKFDDYTELVSAFSVVALMSFTYNIGIGLTTGFVLYSLCKAARRALGGGQTRFMAVGGFVAFVLYLYA